MANVRKIAGTAPVSEFRLEQNQPNPFRGRTTIRFAIPKSCHVRLAIHDREHKAVQMFVNGLLLAGQYEVVWDGRDGDGCLVRNGYYTYRLEANGFVATRKLEIRNQ